MISSRRLALLLPAGILVIALALWFSSRTPHEEAVENGDKPVLPGLTNRLNGITEVRLIRGDGTRTTLRKGNTAWIVGERDYAADSGRVRKLLLDLAQLRVVEDKTRDPANYPQIGVEEVSSPKATGTRVELAEPARTTALIVGKPSGAKSSYVRVAGDAQSWLGSPQLSVEADPRRWLDNAIVDLPEARIKEVAVEPASGPTYTVSRKTAQQSDFDVSPIPKGRELASPGMGNPIAGALASLTLDDVHKLAGAAPAERPRVTFHTFDGLTVTLTGRQDGDHHYVRVSANSSTPETQQEAKSLSRFADWELEIPGYKYDAAFRPMEDLLKKPEPPKTKDEGKGAAAKGAAGKGAPDSTGLPKRAKPPGTGASSPVGSNP